MNDSGSSAPRGWYPDGQSGQRWWDGTQWGPEGQPPSGPTEPGAPPPTMAMPTSPPPQYAAQTGSPPPGLAPTGAATEPGASGTNIKLLLGIVGGLVGVAVLVIVLVLLLGGGDGPSSDDPAETVTEFFDAAADGDCDAAFALLTDNARTTFGADVGVEECESADPSQAFGAEVSIDIGTARIDGDDATVPVTATDDSGELDALGLGELTVDFVLQKQDGVWLIDDLGLDSLLENLPDLPGLPGATEFGDGPDDPFSDLPSDWFSDFPSDLFSDFPTDFNPEDFMSDFPSDLFSDLPTE